MNSIFLKSSDPILGKVSKEISQNQLNSKETKQVIQKMLKIASGEQKDPKKPIMVGLAAPQIGISKRIIVVDVKADGTGPLRRSESEVRKVGDINVFINPEIIWYSQQKEEWYEGCYSLSEVCGIVSRPTSIKIRAFVFDKVAPLSRCDLNITGYVARIFQHEIDHLNGKFFFERIKNPDHLHHVKKEEFPLYRDREAWRNWPKKYTKLNISKVCDL